MKSRLIIALIMISALVIVSISYLFTISSSEEKNTITVSDIPDVYDEQVEEKSNTVKSKKISLKINEVSDYKKMTKAEIYELRKKYVSQSLFANSNYVPSEEVFGAIADKSPWYGLTYSGCIGMVKGTSKVAQGPSEESRFINNPNILVGILSGSQRIQPDDPGCFDKRYWLIPESMTYDKATNTIEATYNFRYTGPMALTGINARDLGYKYVYAKNPINYKFDNTPNISHEVFELIDYIHLGGSCEYKNGCNNGSPYQPYLNLKLTNFPVSIKLKLWKKMPNNKISKPDINYIITFK